MQSWLLQVDVQESLFDDFPPNLAGAIFPVDLSRQTSCAGSVDFFKREGGAHGAPTPAGTKRTICKFWEEVCAVPRFHRVEFVKLLRATAQRVMCVRLPMVTMRLVCGSQEVIGSPTVSGCPRFHCKTGSVVFAWP